MMYSADLWLFFVVVFGVTILPGVDMAFVLGQSLVGGPRTGLTAVAGIVTGSIFHVLMGVLGISILLTTVPGAFNILLFAGALYIAWIGYSVVRSDAVFKANPGNADVSRGHAYRRGVVNIMLNPKAYLFILTIFPQFFRPEYGAIWLQAIVLWIIIAATQIGVYGSVAVAGGSLRGWLVSNPGAAKIVNWVVGTALILVAAASVFHSLQSL